MVNPITYILRKWAFVRMGVYEFQYKSEFKISDGYNMFTYRSEERRVGKEC